jgi:DNA-binding transcriptional regulator YiaG
MREHVGMTKVDFAAAIGCTSTAVYMWEERNRRPSKIASKLLSDVFGRPLDQRRAEVAA